MDTTLSAKKYQIAKLRELSRNFFRKLRKLSRNFLKFVPD